LALPPPAAAASHNPWSGRGTYSTSDSKSLLEIASQPRYHPCLRQSFMLSWMEDSAIAECNSGLAIAVIRSAAYVHACRPPRPRSNSTIHRFPRCSLLLTAREGGLWLTDIRRGKNLERRLPGIVFGGLR